MRNIAFFIIFILLVASCSKVNRNKYETNQTLFENEEDAYPESKIWAHRVNDTIIAKQKEGKFAGFEIDLYYSSTDNDLYVCHDLEDTILNLTIDEWFSALESPTTQYYWFDTKNLTYNNADNIASIIIKTMEKFKIKGNKIFIESWNKHGLKKIKQYPIKTILWVENLNWKEIDTTEWYNNTQKAINNVNPDAISCEFGMFPLLCDTFPNTNIHFWHTPAEATENNFKLTREICKKKNVKVVLVDYDQSIDY